MKKQQVSGKKEKENLRKHRAMAKHEVRAIYNINLLLIIYIKLTDMHEACLTSLIREKYNVWETLF